MPIKTLTATIILAISTVSAQATITLDWVEVDNGGLIPGFRTFDMITTVDAGPWGASAMLFRLTRGSFYQHPMGDISIVNTAFFDLIPELEFDTFLSEDDKRINVLGAGGDVGGNMLEFSTTELDVSWQASPFPPQSMGAVRTARITLSDDAVGAWSIAAVEGTGIIWRFSGTVEDIVPEPSSLLLCFVGAAGLVLRSR